MIKKNILTALGIILSFVIAICGWVITSRLIDVESYRLLSGSVSFPVNLLAIDTYTDGDTGDPNIIFGLSEDDIISVLANRALQQLRRPHEPVPGQIDMDTAIIVAQAGLAFISEHNILPHDIMHFDHTVAFLEQNTPPDAQFFPTRYSFWTVSFHGERVTVIMSINAVAGQIWGIEIHMNRPPSYIYVPHIIAPTSPEYWRPAPRARAMVCREELVSALSAFLSGLGLYVPGGAMYGVLYQIDFDVDSNIMFYDFDEDEEIIESLVHYVGPDGAVMWGRWHENTLMLAQRIARGRAGVEVWADGMITPDEKLYFQRLSIRLAV